MLGKLKNKHKVSKFTDKRIGAKDGIENGEDVMLDRFTALHQKTSTKYSLGGADSSHSLTHAGKSIDEMDHFSDPDFLPMKRTKQVVRLIVILFSMSILWI